MRDFNRGRGSGNSRYGGFSRGRNFRGGGYGSNDRSDRQMFSAVCSDCGKDCQVPFKPTGEKPVYCSECFEKMGGKSERRSFDRPRQEDRNTGNSDLKIQLEALNRKLDTIIGLLQPQQTKVEIKAAKAKKASPQEEKTK